MRVNLLSIHFCMALLFLSTVCLHHPFSYKRPKSLRTKTSTPLLRALVTGEKYGLKAKVIKQLKDIGAIHLLTPSGLHLSVILLFTKKIFKNKLFQILILISSFLLSLYTNSFFSLRRMSSFYLFKNYFSTINSFLLTFFIDYVFGSFHESPVSWMFSYLFIGIIIFNSKAIALPLYLFLGQCLINFIFVKKVYLLSFFTNQIATFIFSCLYPFIFILYTISQIVDLLFINSYLEKTLIIIINTINSYTVIIPSIELNFSFIIILLLVVSGAKKKNLLICLFILYSHPLYKFEKSPSISRYKNFIISPPLISGSKIIYKKNKIIIKSKKKKCSLKLYREHLWQIKCKRVTT